MEVKTSDMSGCPTTFRLHCIYSGNPDQMNLHPNLLTRHNVKSDKTEGQDLVSFENHSPLTDLVGGPQWGLDCRRVRGVASSPRRQGGATGSLLQMRYSKLEVSNVSLPWYYTFITYITLPLSVIFTTKSTARNWTFNVLS